MQQEQIEHLRAEAEKFRAEAESLRQNGWRKPSSWVPSLAALVAISTSLTQCQLSSISDREQAVEAREQAFEARLTQEGLVKRNVALQRDAQALTAEAIELEKSIVDMKSRHKLWSERLIETVSKYNLSAEQLADIESQIDQQAENLQSLAEKAVVSIETDGFRGLLEGLDHSEKRVRIRSTQALISDFGEDPAAIAAALDRFSSDRIGELSPSGRINVMVYLSNSDRYAWTSELLQRGNDAITLIRKRHEQGIAAIGDQTRSALADLERFINSPI